MEITGRRFLPEKALEERFRQLIEKGTISHCATERACSIATAGANLGVKTAFGTKFPGMARERILGFREPSHRGATRQNGSASFVLAALRCFAPYGHSSKLTAA